jgi:hypothetical protein
MVAGQHKLSRRALLAGACALPLSRHAELDSASSSPPRGRVTSWTLKQVQGDDGASRERWRDALDRFDEASREIEALVHCRNQRVYDRALGRHSTALRRLLRAPAPDLAAAGLKLELVVRHQVFEASFAQAALASLRRDIGRFAALASP